MSRTLSNSYTVEQARAYILDAVQTLPAQAVAVQEAIGRVLAQDIVSPLDMPAYDNSAMDGFAFHRDALKTDGNEVRLSIIGESLAGHPFTQAVPSGSCIRITTGALVPTDCDTVIPWEVTQSDETTVRFDAAAARAGANVRKQGENIARGTTVLTKGTRIEPLHVGLLASLGYAEIAVHAKPVVAVIATGDELLQPGQPWEPHRIYNSNTSMLAGLLAGLNVECLDCGVLKDDPEQVRDVLTKAAQSAQLILMTGGAADSKADISQQMLRELGDIAPWTVFMRPGHPMRFGRVQNTPAFVLPGNPVAACVTFLEFARGALLAMQGAEAIWPETTKAILGCPIKKKPGRAEFMRATLGLDDQLRPVATPVRDQGSASLLPMVQAAVIIALDHQEQPNVGDIVTIHRLDRLSR